MSPPKLDSIDRFYDSTHTRNAVGDQTLQCPQLSELPEPSEARPAGHGPKKAAACLAEDPTEILGPALA